MKESKTLHSNQATDTFLARNHFFQYQSKCTILMKANAHLFQLCL